MVAEAVDFTNKSSRTGRRGLPSRTVIKRALLGLGLGFLGLAPLLLRGFGLRLLGFALLLLRFGFCLGSFALILRTLLIRRRVRRR